MASDLTYIRIPKTGSVTFLDAMGRVPGSADYPYILPDVHTPARVYTNDGIAHSYFTMVRDPLQMHASAYYAQLRRIEEVKAEGEASGDTGGGILMPIRLITMAVPNLEVYLQVCPENFFLTEYFSGLRPEDFTFIGHTPEMDDSLRLFSAITGIHTTYGWENANPTRNSAAVPYTVSARTERIFRIRNEREYDLYERSLARYAELKAQYLS